jgi:hypothetical protein
VVACLSISARFLIDGEAVVCGPDGIGGIRAYGIASTARIGRAAWMEPS